MESAFRAQTLEQYVSIYDHTCARRCVVTEFELIALATRPHATPIVQLDAHVYRLTRYDPVADRMMYNCNLKQTRVAHGVTGVPWLPAPTHEQIRARSILSATTPKPRAPRITRTDLAAINRDLNKLK